MIGRPENEVSVRAEGVLRAFNEAGVLAVADVTIARRLCMLAGESDERVRLAVALTVRAIRHGSVCLDLTRAAGQAVEQVETHDELPWPDPSAWLDALRASAAVATDDDPSRPLRLQGTLLYLQRYWQEEEFVRIDLQQRADAAPPEIDEDGLTAALDICFGPADLSTDDQQRRAAEMAARRRLAVVAGGPGTGKTYTVARLLACVQAATPTPLRIALTAPTGKAAARLEESVRAAAADLADGWQHGVENLTASTLHRLLGWQAHTPHRFVHHAANQLPHDVVVVDEMSMVSLTMLSRLLEAVPATSRLVLVGDPDQLTSIEAGAVMADITRSAGRVHDGVVELGHYHRFDTRLQDVAAAIRRGDAEATTTLLMDGSAHPSEGTHVALHDSTAASWTEHLRRAVVAAARRLHEAALAGDAEGALAALARHRVLCAHASGPYGVSRWARQIETWARAAVPGMAAAGEWYPGRPLLVTSNNRDIGLSNGDTGVVVDTPNGPRAAFVRGDRPTLFAPSLLDDVQTVFAMTIHKAQGSQFDNVAVVLPPADAPLLTRELLYTALTRATRQVDVYGTADAVRAAVARPARRASGLRERL